MSEKKVILSIWAAVIALLIGSMLLAGILASSRPEYRAHPGLETCAVQDTELYDAQQSVYITIDGPEYSGPSGYFASHSMRLSSNRAVISS